MELDNDSNILAALPEVTDDTGATVKQVDSPPYAYLVTSEALAEFVKLYNPVCMSKDCGHQMELDRLASISLSAVVYLICPEGHKWMWQSASASLYSQMPTACNRLFHAALTAGMGFTEFLEFSQEAGFKKPEGDHSHGFQNGPGLVPSWTSAVEEVSQESTKAAREFVKKRDGKNGSVLYMDARFDSFRDGFHGTVPALDSETGKCLALVTLTRKETGSSWKTEDACVRQCIEELIEAGLIISEVVHDDKASVDSILAEFGIKSSKDLWHKCKNLCAKFKEDLARAKKAGLSKVEDAKSLIDLKSATVPMLKEYLKAHSLALSGNKDALMQRVWAHLDKDITEEPVDEDARLMKYPEVNKNNLADKLKTHVYTACRKRAAEKDDLAELLCKDIHNAADHWAGDHLVCA
jgi:hypothetical protein